MTNPSWEPPQIDRARGLLLGLVLGDALPFDDLAPGQWRRNSAGGQLACYAVEGLIRAHVRGSHKGICHPPSMVFAAYTRWAHVQGHAVPKGYSYDGLPWPSGWLSQQRLLSESRGTAPATLNAVLAGQQGTLDEASSNSAGHHALTHAAPAALFAYGDLRQLALEIAGLTHGSPLAQQAAAEGVLLLAQALRTRGTLRQLDVGAALRAGPRDAPTGTAMQALGAGIEAVRERPAVEDLLSALAAAHHTGGRGAAAYAGALFGAVHGAGALPQEELERCELSVTADTLARDAMTEQLEGPSGSEYAPNADRWWWRRYPGY